MPHLRDRQDAETGDLHARAAARRFQAALEDQLKRSDATSLILAASARLVDVQEGRRKISQWRPHHLIHAIEAMCAYRRGHRSTPADNRALARVTNIYHKHDDPYTDYLLTKQQDLHLAFRTMATQQFRFQYRAHYKEIARAYSIFGKGLEQTAQRFLSEHSLSILDWFRLSLCCFALISKQRPPVVTAKRMRSACGWGVPPIEPAAVDAFLRSVSRTVPQTGQQFRAEREALDKPYLHGLIRSGFIDRPLLEFELGRYVCPSPGLLFLNAADGLLKRCRQFDPAFGAETGEAFEDYVQGVLAQMPSRQLIRPDRLEHRESNRACDFAVETDDAIILIECKAVSETTRFMIEAAIRDQNATTKIQDALEQLRHTARLAAESALGLEIAERPIYAIVVTYGSILFANSTWHRERILRWDESSAGPHLNLLPNVLSIADLEQFVLAVAATDLTARQLIEKREAQEYLEGGDWDTFLPRQFNARQRSEARLDVARRDMEELWRLTMGDEKYERLMDWREPDQ